MYHPKVIKTKIPDTMSVLYFPKPQPLSPNTKTVEVDGVRFRTVKGRKVRVRGVATTDSIYYLWFEYLKRSEKYKTACANNGKGMKKLYSDFGDVFAYKGIGGFWDWWTERGQYLFGIKPINQLDAFATVDDVNSIAKQVDEGTYRLVAIPTNLTKTTIKKRLNKLLTELKVTPTAQQTAKYSVAQSKVDVDSLETCLMAYDLKQKGKDILDIGIEVRWIKTTEAKDLIEDGRKKGKEVEFEKLVEMSENNYKQYLKLLSKAQAFVRKRLKDKYETIDADDLDDLVDKEMRIYKVDYVRTRRKNSIRTNTHKLINKAKANIEAVEKGMFGVGH